MFVVHSKAKTFVMCGFTEEVLAVYKHEDDWEHMTQLELRNHPAPEVGEQRRKLQADLKKAVLLAYLGYSFSLAYLPTYLPTIYICLATLIRTYLLLTYLLLHLPSSLRLA